MNLTMQKKLHKLIFIIFSVGAASCISLIGGLGLESVQEKILPLIPLLIALPGLNTMVGDYAATIAAHAGNPDERKSTKKALVKAISRVMWVNIIGILALSIGLALSRGYAIEANFLLKFIIFVASSIILVITAMFFITTVLDIILRKNRLNPDDVLIPIVTTISDILMLGLIALSVVLIF